ncbi:MAG TPA: electron transfer flavoprotein subunit beta/FixA family protein [Sporichthyaceae bacterium]|jgi:electron transfer flavoprotein beta subunit|nr:electron transfer flavoprotein subunit beta/FixA family protein [Sporichthyaceae bacterium]
MDIVVCVKQVPDTWAEKKLKPDTQTLDRGGDNILNEMDEFAIEAALQLTEAHGGSVKVLSMGPDSATDAIRKALSMGADGAVHVIDDALAGSDAVGTSLALSKALERIGSYDMVIAGSESSDSRTSVVPAMLAERLGLPQLTFVRKIEVDGSAVKVERMTDDGYQVVAASLPAVVSVIEKMNEPRYPSFKGIMAAKKKPVDVVSAADLGLDAASVGLSGSWTAVADAANRPPRTAGTVVDDEGNGGNALVEFLAGAKFV